MLNFTFAGDKKGEYEFLLLGAHSDDIEIGCGGTVLTLADRYPNARFTWIVFSGRGSRAEEARASAEAFLARATCKQVILKAFKDGFFPYMGAEIKTHFEALKRELSPDVIFTHARHDLHQDHRLLCELTWNTFRDHVILEYEIPKYDGDLGNPNVYMALEEAICRQKIALLLRHFPTQAGKHWFSEETFRALLCLRGIEARAPEGYAEAFYGRRIVL